MKRLLIVDDSPIFQKILTKVLAPHFDIVGAGSSGQEGFDLYQVLKPDLVLLDIVMPNCSGKESLEMILKLDPHAVVIMVTSLGDEVTINECLALGAKAFVNKANVSHTDDLSSPILRTILAAIPQSPHQEVL